MTRTIATGLLLLALALPALALPALAQAPPNARGEMVSRGRQLFFDRGCARCHTLGKAGTPIAIDAARMAQKYSEADLIRWLRDPATAKLEAHMPKLDLSEADLHAIAAFVVAQKDAAP